MGNIRVVVVRPRLDKWHKTTEFKLICMVLGGLILMLLAVPIHELGHYLVARIMGVSGSIDLYWHGFDSVGGGFYYDGRLTSVMQDRFIAFWGGGFVALVYFIGWLCLPLKRLWYVSVPILALVAWSIYIGVSELICWW